jgi:hypothetical protein
MTGSSRTHCNDATLIAHLDGELPFYARGWVRRHLTACWPCRLRLSELEEQILNITKLVEEDDLLGPGRIAEARTAIFSRTNEIATAARVQPKVRALSMRAGLAAAAVILIALCVKITLGTRQAGSPVPARDVMTRIAAAEAAPSQGLIHQEFHLIASELRPAPTRREMNLELWSEPSRQRFAARVEDPGGRLRYAIWQPALDRAFAYSEASPARATPISIPGSGDRWNDIVLPRGDLKVTDLEDELIGWLQHRAWRPISLASSVARFASEDGAALTAEETACCYRLIARKRVGAIAVEFVVEADKQEYRPRLLSIYYESPDRALELAFRPVPASVARAVSFTPPPSLMPVVPDARHTTVLLPEARQEPVPDLTELEVEVWYALHRAGGCLGEPLEARRTADGRIRVEGIVSTLERRDQLLAALAPLAGPRLAVDLRSANEVLAGPSPSSAIDLQTTDRDRHKLALALKRDFGGDEGAAEAFIDTSLSLGEDLAEEAQALRSLASRFSPEAGNLTSGSALLLSLMTQDHLEALTKKAAGCRRFFESGIGLMPPSQLEAASLPQPVSGQNWADTILQVSDAVRRANAGLRRALTAADPAQLGPLAIEASRELASLDRWLELVANRPLVIRSKRADPLAAAH